MSFEKTLDRFMLLSGLSYDESLRWRSVIEEAVNYVYGLAVKEKLTDSEKARLDTLAGVLAYCRYTLYTADNSGGFRAGDLTVYSDRNTFANAQAIWESELKANADLVSPSYFCFKRVIS